MKPLFKSLFLATTVLLAAGAVAVPAFARSIAAYPGGRAAAANDAACFNYDFGGARNDCNYMAEYTISLPVDSPGWKGVWVNAYGPSSTNDVTCKAIGRDGAVSSGSTSTSGYHALPAFGTSATISATSYVPSGGVLFVYCQVQQNGRINSVAFDY